VVVVVVAVVITLRVTLLRVTLLLWAARRLWAALYSSEHHDKALHDVSGHASSRVGVGLPT